MKRQLNAAALKKLLTEIERLLCLANGADQTDDGTYDVLWRAVEGEPWDLHAQTKDGIDFVFSKAVEVLSDYIHI